MIGLRSLEVYNSIFNINQENNNFELYTDTFDDFSFTQLKDELEEILDFSNFTDENLPDEIKGPRIIKSYNKLETEKRRTDGYYMLIMGCAKSLFCDFESYLPIVVGLDEDDIQLILKQNIEKFITCQLSRGVYNNEDISKAVYTMNDHEGTLQIEHVDDDDTVETKLVLTVFGLTFGTLRLGKKSFFIQY